MVGECVRKSYKGANHEVICLLYQYRYHKFKEVNVYARKKYQNIFKRKETFTFHTSLKYFQNVLKISDVFVEKITQ